MKINKNDFFVMLEHNWDLKPETMLKLLKDKGLEVEYWWYNQLPVIERHNFTVAKCIWADALQIFRNSIIEALQEGKPFEEWKKDVKNLLNKKGYSKNAEGKNWHYQTIFRTNIQGNFMQQRWNEMEKLKKDFPYRKYVAVTDDRTTDMCNSLNGKIFKSDDIFWQYFTPPNHYNCRSRVESIHRLEAKYMKLKISTLKEIKGVAPDETFMSSPGKYNVDYTKYDKSIAGKLKKVVGKGKRKNK